MPNSASRTDRDRQDDIIRYLSDASLRKQGARGLPISAKDAARAERFARFLARRYYRDRLVRSFRYSRLFAGQIGRVAGEIVDLAPFNASLDECVLGSLDAARRVGELAVAHLTTSGSPGPWWQELLEYEQAFFLQAATAEHGSATSVPRAGTSALCHPFHWNLPELLARLKAGDSITDELENKVVLLFSRTHSGRIYVVELDQTTMQIFRHADGVRDPDQIAQVASLPPGTVQNTLQALSKIGAVDLPRAAASL